MQVSFQVAQKAGLNVALFKAGLNSPVAAQATHPLVQQKHLSAEQVLPTAGMLSHRVLTAIPRFGNSQEEAAAFIRELQEYSKAVQSIKASTDETAFKDLAGLREILGKQNIAIPAIPAALKRAANTPSSERPFEGLSMSDALLPFVNLANAKLSGIDLSNADLRGANLTKADLRSADLSGANLSEANLREAFLVMATLTGADLTKADLFDANLSGATLAKADLIDADLREANLDRADLSGADLCGADLSGADLRGANLTGADLRSADLSGADLRGTDLRGAVMI